MKLLSRSSFADIYLFEDGEKYIVKKYHRAIGDEAFFLRLLNGIYTPALYRSDSESVTMEYIDGTDLGTYLRAHALPSLEKRMLLMRSIAHVYSFFHSNGVLHMDPKPGNILIKKDESIKIIDFQLSTLIEAPRSILSEHGIPYYWYSVRPPESFRPDFTPTIKSEIYALGQLFYYILHSRFLFESFITEDEYERKKDKIREFHEHIDRVNLPDEPLYGIISAMMQRDERLRPDSMNTVVQSLKSL